MLKRALGSLVSGCCVYGLVALWTACSGGGASGGGLPGEAGVGAGGTVSGGVPKAHASSGNRLKARRMVAEDGADEFIGWFDSARNENCYFQRAADGVLRCMPEAGSADAYADATCETPIVEVDDDDCPKNEIKYVSVDKGCYSYVIHPVQQVAQSSTVFERSDDGTCKPYDYSTPRNWYVGTKDPLPVTDFIAAIDKHD